MKTSPTQPNVFEVRGDAGYRDLLDLVRGVTEDLHNPGAVWVIANRGDRETFAQDFRSRFRDQTQAQALSSRIVSGEDHEGGDGRSVIHFSLASRRDAEVLVDEIKKRDKDQNEYPIKIVVVLYPTEDSEAFLPLLLQRCPTVKVYEFHLPDPEQEQGIVARLETTGKVPDWRNFGELTPKVLKWLWPKRVVLGGVTIFSGDPSMAKSLMALTVCATGAANLPQFPDSALNELGHFESIYLSAEDDPETVTLPRLMALAKLEEVRSIHTVTTVRFVTAGESESFDERLFTLESDLDLIRQKIEQTPAIKLVLIDPLSNYMGGKNMYRDQEMRQILMPLTTLAQELSIAVIVIMHNGKQAGRSALQKVAASLGGTGVARIGWTFVKKDERVKKMLLMKENLGKFPGMEFTTEGATVEIDGLPTEQATIKFLGQTEESADTAVAANEDPQVRKENSARRDLEKSMPEDTWVSSEVLKGFQQTYGRGLADTLKVEYGLRYRRSKEGTTEWQRPQSKAQVVSSGPELF